MPTLIEYRNAKKVTVYHVVNPTGYRPLCNRWLSGKQTQHERTFAQLAVLMKNYDVAGGRMGGTVRACRDCHNRMHLLNDPVTRMGDLVRETPCTQPSDASSIAATTTPRQRPAS